MLPALFPYKLLPYGFRRKYRPQRFIPRQKDLKSAYDVVIIGGGGHALACAYYLARNHGITDVCILEKGYLAGGNTARNTAIIRSNYLTPEGVRFYEQSLKLYRDLSQELFPEAWKEYQDKHYEATMEVKRFYLLQHDRRKWNVIEEFPL